MLLRARDRRSVPGARSKSSGSGPGISSKRILDLPFELRGVCWGRGWRAAFSLRMGEVGLGRRRGDGAANRRTGPEEVCDVKPLALPLVGRTAGDPRSGAMAAAEGGMLSGGAGS